MTLSDLPQCDPLGKKNPWLHLFEVKVLLLRDAGCTKVRRNLSVLHNKIKLCLPIPAYVMVLGCFGIAEVFGLVTFDTQGKQPWRCLGTNQSCSDLLFFSCYPTSQIPTKNAYRFIAAHLSPPPCLPSQSFDGRTPVRRQAEDNAPDTNGVRHEYMNTVWKQNAELPSLCFLAFMSSLLYYYVFKCNHCPYRRSERKSIIFVQEWLPCATGL